MVQVRRNGQWRKTANLEKAAQPSQTGQRMSSKEERLVKMVTAFSILFIVCYTPSVAMISAEFSMFGRYHSIYYVTVSGLLFQSISTSVNIFIYYYMGSKFKNIFHKTELKSRFIMRDCRFRGF